VNGMALDVQVFDTVYLVVNTPPKIVTSQAIRNSAVAEGEYRFAPQGDDADGDTVRFHLLSTIDGMAMAGHRAQGFCACVLRDNDHLLRYG
jgi:hypothetical protein